MLLNSKMTGVVIMPWCPKCKVEYVEGIKECSDCGSNLKDEPEDGDERAYRDSDHEVLLMSVNDEMESNIIESKLSEYGIPVLRKYKQSGGYLNIYMGATPFGVDLYVPSKALDKANEILDLSGNITDEQSDELKQDEGLEVEKFDRKRMLRAWVILLVMASGGIVGLIYYLVEKFW